MEDDILIDNYFKGLLSKDEEKSFLERLNSDADFSEKFKLEKQLFNSLNEESWSFVENINAEVSAYLKLLEDTDLKNLKKTLEETNLEFKNEPQKGTTTRRLFYYIIAASVVVSLGFQFFFNQNSSNQELFNGYVALNDLPSFVSRSDSTDDLAKAQRLFEDKKYEEAISVFQTQLNESDAKANIYIYQGLAQTELEKYDDAEKTFNTLISGNLIDSEKGYWYKALLYLKMDRVEEANQLLDDIISKTLYNHKKAKQLLSDL
jgi:hypothetical protein